MKKMFLTLAAALAIFAIPTGADAQEKRLDPEIYDQWKTIAEHQLSPNGNWVTYEVRPAQGDGVLYIHDTRTGAKREVERGTGARIFGSQRWLTYRVNPAFAEMRKAQLANTPRNAMPKQKTYLLNLMTGDTINITDVESPVFIEKAPRMAFRMKVPKPVEQPTAAPDSLPTPPPAPGDDTLRTRHQQPQRPPQQMQRPNQSGGEDVIFCIVDLEKKDTLARIKDIGMFSFTGNGSRLVYTAKEDTITTLNLWNNGNTRQLVDFGKDRMGKLVLDQKNENQIAYTVQPNDTVKKPYELYQMSLTTFTPRRIDYTLDGFELATDQNDALGFSPKGNVLMFMMKEPDKEPVKDTLLQSEKFTLELWSHTDTLAQSQQHVSSQRGRGGQRTVPVLYYLKENFGRRMDQGSFRGVNTPNSLDDARFFTVSDSRPYQSVSAWDITNPRDYSIYWPREDRTEHILTKVAGGVAVSPTTKWIVWFDTDSRTWNSLDPDTKEKRNLTAELDVPFWNELYDWPGTPREAGGAGWVKTGAGRSLREYFIVYDRYDLWMLDPSGRQKPRRITDGRPTHTTFRPLVTDRSATYMNQTQTVFLHSENEDTRDEGFWTIRVDGNGNLAKKVTRHIEGPYKLTLSAKAKDADRVIWTRQSYTEFPDMCTSTGNFQNEVKLSDANPEMKDYLWGSAELIHWTSAEGKPMKGLLYLPGGYEPGNKYPGLVYFYEKITDGLNNFHNPAPSWSVIVPPMYTSNGYAILMPDIDYTFGEPCISALKATVSASEELVRRGICEPDRIGINGQSWGGTQLNYILTQTDAFRCASVGAGESDMISGYGDIRWDSGSPRQFLYETGQTRLGGTLWEMPENYIKNSAIFHLPNVNTPILLRHSNNDGAVPYVQAIEMFNGLRRLGKPVWLLNYQGGGHNLSGWGMRKDFALRMQQFFDHYLKDAPRPRWMVEGISVEERPTQLKLDLVE